MRTGSYAITINWKPAHPEADPRLEIKEFRNRADMLNTYADYLRRTGKDVLSVTIGRTL